MEKSQKIYRISTYFCVTIEKNKLEGIDISTENTNTTENKKGSGKIVLIILLAILAVYLIVTVIFSYITLPNTFVNGKDVSYATKASVLDTSRDDFKLKIIGKDDRELSFMANDIDYVANLPKNASLDQNPFSRPLAFFRKGKEDFDFDYQVKYDEDKLDDIINSSKLMEDVTEPENARIEYKDGKFEILKEVEGNKIDYNKLKDEIVSAIYTKKDELVLDDDFYIMPTIREDDPKLNKEIADVKVIEGLSYDFNINGYDKKLEGKEFVEMFDFDDKNATVELDYDKIHDYVEQIADETNTYGKDRKFNATGIGEITVNPGVYGFILDVDATVDNIYKLVNERKSGTIEPEYERRGFTREADGSDIGNTYVEVDLSRQYMWYYQDGQVMFESNLVSGNLAEGALTNVGVGSILSKERDSTLKGENFDGVSNYETPVKYWMPIGRDGEGFHDGWWRGAFGGVIYQTDGSHGCLNLPEETARMMFEMVEHNTPVVVYESSTNFSPPMTY